MSSLLVERDTKKIADPNHALPAGHAVMFNDLCRSVLYYFLHVLQLSTQVIDTRCSTCAYYADMAPLESGCHVEYVPFSQAHLEHFEVCRLAQCVLKEGPATIEGIAERFLGQQAACRMQKKLSPSMRCFYLLFDVRTPFVVCGIFDVK